jgi:hypothetical protein
LYLTTLIIHAPRCPRTCVHPFSAITEDGEIVRRVCGRWRCSQECCVAWSRGMSRRLIETLRERPATHHVRLTCHHGLPYHCLSRHHSRFFRTLRRRTRCQYFAINHWSDSGRHLHALVRTSTELGPGLIGELWSQEIPGGSYHCGPIRDQVAIARYVVRAMRDRVLEVPPDSFGGRLFSSSRDFF